jgi:MerR family transcriptional regulator, copper efflux regulator
MDALTINEAAETTGWSPRMLRYIERAGLIVPRRSDAGYRLYGAGELQRLRTLRELLERFGIALSDVGFARRMREDGELQEAVGSWLQAPAARPEEVSASDWLRWEQDKHNKLLNELMEAA